MCNSNSGRLIRPGGRLVQEVQQSVLTASVARNFWVVRTAGFLCLFQERMEVEHRLNTIPNLYCNNGNLAKS